MNIPRRGFVPGETILISAQINNFSNKPISYVKAELVQVMKTTMFCCTYIITTEALTDAFTNN